MTHQDPHAGEPGKAPEVGQDLADLTAKVRELDELIDQVKTVVLSGPDPRGPKSLPAWFLSDPVCRLSQVAFLAGGDVRLVPDKERARENPADLGRLAMLECVNGKDEADLGPLWIGRDELLRLLRSCRDNLLWRTGKLMDRDLDALLAAIGGPGPGSDLQTCRDEGRVPAWFVTLHLPGQVLPPGAWRLTPVADRIAAGESAASVSSEVRMVGPWPGTGQALPRARLVPRRALVAAVLHAKARLNGDLDGRAADFSLDASPAALSHLEADLVRTAIKTSDDPVAANKEIVEAIRGFDGTETSRARLAELRRVASAAQRDAIDRRLGFDLAVAFDRAWDKLSELGACDGRGGAEHARIKAAWEAAGRPEEVHAFIDNAANGAPFDRKETPVFRKWVGDQIKELLALGATLSDGQGADFVVDQGCVARQSCEDHAGHGSGPEPECHDCACRGSSRQGACAAAGCGFCKGNVSAPGFAAHLEQSSALVATWPEWKRRVLGGSQGCPEPTPNHLRPYENLRVSSDVSVPCGADLPCREHAFRPLRLDYVGLDGFGLWEDKGGQVWELTWADREAPKDSALLARPVKLGPVANLEHDRLTRQVVAVGVWHVLRLRDGEGALRPLPGWEALEKAAEEAGGDASVPTSYLDGSRKPGTSPRKLPALWHSAAPDWIAKLDAWADAGGAWQRKAADGTDSVFVLRRSSVRLSPNHPEGTLVVDKPGSDGPPLWLKADPGDVGYRLYSEADWQPFIGGRVVPWSAFLNTHASGALEARETFVRAVADNAALLGELKGQAIRPQDVRLALPTLYAELNGMAPNKAALAARVELVDDAPGRVEAIESVRRSPIAEPGRLPASLIRHRLSVGDVLVDQPGIPLSYVRPVGERLGADLPEGRTTGALDVADAAAKVAASVVPRTLQAHGLRTLRQHSKEARFSVLTEPFESVSLGGRPLPLAEVSYAEQDAKVLAVAAALPPTTPDDVFWDRLKTSWLRGAVMPGDLDQDPFTVHMLGFGPGASAYKSGFGSRGEALDYLRQALRAEAVDVLRLFCGEVFLRWRDSDGEEQTHRLEDADLGGSPDKRGAGPAEPASLALLAEALEKEARSLRDEVGPPMHLKPHALQMLAWADSKEDAAARVREIGKVDKAAMELLAEELRAEAQRLLDDNTPDQGPAPSAWGRADGLQDAAEKVSRVLRAQEEGRGKKLRSEGLLLAERDSARKDRAKLSAALSALAHEIGKRTFEGPGDAGLLRAYGEACDVLGRPPVPGPWIAKDLMAADVLSEARKLAAALDRLVGEVEQAPLLYNKAPLVLAHKLACEALGRQPAPFGIARCAPGAVFTDLAEALESEAAAVRRDASPVISEGAFGKVASDPPSWIGAEAKENAARRLRSAWDLWSSLGSAPFAKRLADARRDLSAKEKAVEARQPFFPGNLVDEQALTRLRARVELLEEICGEVSK